MSKVMVKSSKVSSKSSQHRIIKDIPNHFYQDILNEVFNSFAGKYKMNKYSKTEDVPGNSITELSEFLKTDIGVPIPKDTQSPVVIAGIYSRKSSTHIGPPKKNCALRVLFNLGFDEVYHLDPNGSELEENDIYLKANSYIVLGPIKMSDYKIYVNNNTINKIPMDPTNPNLKRTLGRPNHYLRVTLVFDYEIDEKLMENLNQISDNIPKVRMNNTSSKKELDSKISNIIKEHQSLSSSSTSLPERDESKEKNTSEFFKSISEGLNPEEQEELMKMMDSS